MVFHIDPSAALPIYRQIVEQLRRHVASGEWRAGNELPSVRALALQHTINPMTVSKAYSLLEAEGLVERRRGQAMVVADVKPTTRVSQRLSLLEPALQAAALQATQLKLEHDAALQLFARCLRHANDRANKQAQAQQRGDEDKN